MKVATLNLWGVQGEWARRLQVAAEVMRDADVVLCQEVHVEGSTHTGRYLAGLLGWHCAYGAATVEEKQEEGLAIIAREEPREVVVKELPDARPRDRRILLLATVAGVRIGTTHLHYRMNDGLARERQVAAIDAALAGATGVKIVGGDFNATPDSDEIRFLTGRHTLEGRRTFWQDAWRGPDPGITWSRKNPYTAPLHWLEMERRIDYVFVSPEQRNGKGRVVSTRIIGDEARDGVWASDHFGVLAEIDT
jgi:endonuclease/exonuclease/phosphatase family metal-dependent hydrolase